MPFKPGESGNPSGRIPGSPNKLNKTVRETILQVHNILEDDPIHNMLQFAKKFPKEYRAIESKLIPSEVVATIDMTVNWNEEKTYEIKHQADSGA